jgi:metal-dependent amidase/aminoacylase/carboxypeptidase family protein
MTREELKHRVDEAIERHADEIVAVGEAIRRHPELGFKELRTSALVETKFRQLGLAPRTGLAITGVRADAVGGAGPGPTFALVGELDALVVAGHPEADRLRRVPAERSPARGVSGRRVSRAEPDATRRRG